jgi:hypothetical protein
LHDHATYSRRFRSASFEIVPAGHFLHFERPEIVETYVTFLTS